MANQLRIKIGWKERKWRKKKKLQPEFSSSAFRRRRGNLRSDWSIREKKKKNKRRERKKSERNDACNIRRMQNKNGIEAEGLGSRN